MKLLFCIFTAHKISSHSTNAIGQMILTVCIHKWNCYFAFLQHTKNILTQQMSLAERYRQSIFINEIVILQFYSTKNLLTQQRPLAKRSWQSAFKNDIIILHFFSTQKSPHWTNVNDQKILAVCIHEWNCYSAFFQHTKNYSHHNSLWQKGIISLCP